MDIALSIGNFDAVHHGHVKIVKAAREAVGEGRVVLWSFNPSPTTILRPELKVEQLTMFSTRRNLLLEAGADEVVALTPTKELLSQSPEQFVKYFVKSVSPQFVVEGEGFHFGRNRSGTLADLQKMGPSYAFSTIRVPPVELALRDQSIHRASSSLVRKLIKLGRVEDATIVLGRPVTIMGTVVEGDQRGRLMHFPTANIGKIETLLPAEGIYAGRGVLEDGTVFPAAISIGTKPTFGLNETVCEAHLIGYEGEADMYGWQLTLRFDHWLRDQIRFDSVEELKVAIQADVENTTRLFERNP